ncbi:MAG: hypothetical protein U0527_14225 [Candidatus Eisenbacteria bacterium]
MPRPAPFVTAALAVVVAVCLLDSRDAVADGGEPVATIVPSDALNGVICCPNLPTPLAELGQYDHAKNEQGNALSNVSVVVLLTASNPTCPAAVLEWSNHGGGADPHHRRLRLQEPSASAAVVKANGVAGPDVRQLQEPGHDGSGGNGAVALPDPDRVRERVQRVTPAGQVTTTPTTA